MNIRGHRYIQVDQPTEAGGTDTAPTPTELFAASLAACIAFYAGSYLHRHGLPRTGLRVRTEFTSWPPTPPRPGRLPARRGRAAAGAPRAAPAACWLVASHCTVHNTLHEPPEIEIELEP